MTIDQMILELTRLRAEHGGELPVCVEGIDGPLDVSEPVVVDERGRKYVSIE